MQVAASDLPQTLSSQFAKPDWDRTADRGILDKFNILTRWFSVARLKRMAHYTNVN